MKIERIGLVLACAPLLGLAPAALQDEGETEGGQSTLHDELSGPGDAEREMIRLFHEVERKLHRISDELSAAGAGEVPLEQVQDAGLDDLLRSARDGSQQVIDDIDKILEMARQMGGKPSAGGGQSKPEGGSPLDQERDRGPQERERTPEAPRDTGEDEGGHQPRNPDQQQQEEPPGNPPAGKNRPGDPQRHDAANTNPSSDAERWGELPVRYRETFRNQGADDVPVQYRDWIDSYYRRLSQRR